MTGITFEIIKTTVQAKSRKLSNRWKVVGDTERWPPASSHLVLREFEHTVNVPSSVEFEKVLEWCKTNVGLIDQDWTWKHVSQVLLKNLNHAVQLSLVMDSL
jgi:hypothetical protein